MKTVGEMIKEKRFKKKLSLDSLESRTKIKVSFISAIEKGDWEKLPPFPVVSGFVRNIASYLEIKQSLALATLKRDYPPKKISLSPKPDLGKEFIWSPRLTFVLGGISILILIIFYLGWQYYKFTSPPSLEVLSPQDNSVLKKGTTLVRGKTDPNATVKVNNQPALVKEDGSFEVGLEIKETTTNLEIKSLSRSRRETIVYRKIVVEK